MLKSISPIPVKRAKYSLNEHYYASKLKQPVTPRQLHYMLLIDNIITESVNDIIIDDTSTKTEHLQ